MGHHCCETKKKKRGSHTVLCSAANFCGPILQGERTSVCFFFLLFSSVVYSPYIYACSKWCPYFLVEFCLFAVTLSSYSLWRFRRPYDTDTQTIVSVVADGFSKSDRRETSCCAEVYQNGGLHALPCCLHRKGKKGVLSDTGRRTHIHFITYTYINASAHTHTHTSTHVL